MGPMYNPKGPDAHVVDTAGLKYLRDCLKKAKFSTLGVHGPVRYMEGLGVLGFGVFGAEGLRSVSFSVANPKP